MIGVVEAVAAGDGVHERGFTFVGAKGPKEDLYLSFHELRLETIRRAQALRAIGLSRGDRLAIVLPEGEEFIPTFLGALWAGVVPVPLYPPVSLGKLDVFMDSLLAILNVAEPKVLVTSERVGKVLWSAIGRAPSLQQVVTPDALRAAESAASGEPAPVTDADVALLQFTSGSTATPKGVVVTHGNLKANLGATLRSAVAMDRDRDVLVSWLPMYHDMGLIGAVLGALLYGTRAVFIPTLSFIKNATLWLETIHKHKGTMTVAPNFAYALVSKRARPEQIKRWDLSQMRVFGCGAEPINPETMRNFVATFAPAGVRPNMLVPMYGMAEATLGMAFVGLDEPLRTDRIDPERYHREKRAVPEGELAVPTSTPTAISTATPTSTAKANAMPLAASGANTHAEELEIVCCGRALPGHELSIQDERGRLLPDRAVGEICFRGPSVARGYWNNPEASRAAGMAEPGGWLRTGDLGYVVNGEVYISGRLKDILIINGRNYYPQRIEWLVDEIPGVRRGSAVVFSRPGTASEQVVVAAETREKDVGALAARIVAQVSDEMQLAVADVALVPPGTLPKTSSGKLQRRKTREQYLSGTLGRGGVRAFGAMGNRLLLAKHFAFSIVGRARHEARGLFRRWRDRGEPPAQAEG